MYVYMHYFTLNFFKYEGNSIKFSHALPISMDPWRFLRVRSRREIREFKPIMTSRRRGYCLSLSLFLFLSSVCFRLDKPYSARSHLFCPKRAAARPVDCENKRLHAAPRGNTTGGGSNDNICTRGISLSTRVYLSLFASGYIGDISSARGS